MNAWIHEYKNRRELRLYNGEWTNTDSQCAKKKSEKSVGLKWRYKTAADKRAVITADKQKGRKTFSVEKTKYEEIDSLEHVRHRVKMQEEFVLLVIYIDVSE